MQIYSPWKGCTNLPVIDLHSHLVPGIDDGAQTHDESLSILRCMEREYGSGSTVVFTPHYSAFMPSRVAEGRLGNVNRFIEGVSEQFHMEFFPAGELLLHGFSLENLEKVRYPGTGFVLVEFNSGVTWVETLLQLRRIIGRGYRPLIAHPERYYWCRKRGDRLVKLSRMGCGSMVSARSLRYPRYAGTARSILAHGLAHAIASDVHSSSDRILSGKVKSELEASSSVPWDVLTYEVPSMILEDRSLPPLPLGRGDS